MGQLDVQAHGNAARLGSALVGRFHDAGAAAGDDAEALFHQHPGQALGIPVFGRIGSGAGRAEDGHAIGVQLVQRIQGLDHFGHDADGSPGLRGHGVEIVDDVLPDLHESLLVARIAGKKNEPPS